MDARDIILQPLITERSTELMADGKYTFKVRLDANKHQIKEAIESIFKVKVLKVNTMRMPGKLRRMGKYIGRRPAWKKAIVQLAEGQTIQVFEGL